MRKKPTLYLDTNILSVLFYRGFDVTNVFRHMRTREWWEGERHWFRVFSSSVCEEELRRGSFPGQKKAVALCCRLPYLSLTGEVRRATDVYLSERLIPESKPLDAVQLALASVHRTDYLLTWNYAHLANAQTQARLEMINMRHQWRIPLLVSPESIPFASMHQEIARNDDE